jgi:dihydroxy-acid dehydratase
LKAGGLKDEQIARPFVGVANSWNEIVPGHVHLAELAQAVKEGIREAGGTPFEFNTIAVCDGIAMGHEGMYRSLPSREVVADSVELMAQAHGFDALVLLGSCDKIVPGMLMAAARVNIPAIVVTGGAMAYGEHQGRVVDLISVFEAVAQVETGSMTEEQLRELEAAACPGPGSCAGMFTANTMACITESLGLSLPGCATALATSEAKRAIARRSGEAIMELLRQGRRPSDIMTFKAFENACRVDLALGGSTNTALHLPAIAHEAQVPFGLADFDRLARTTPHLCSMSPGGPMRMSHLDEAGGVPAVMHELRDRMHLDELAVTGGTIGDYVAPPSPDLRYFDQPVIHSKDEPVHSEGGLAVLRGNLAPDGAVVKQAAVTAEMMQHRGPARVFENEEDAVQAVVDQVVQPGEVLIVRYEGPSGGPGMREMLALTSLISGGPYDGKVALVTDGRFSGGSRGAAIGHVSPEAAAGGAIALIQDGDVVEIDIAQRRLELQLPAEELERRRANWEPRAPRFSRGVLARYAASVTSAATGAVLK